MKFGFVGSYGSTDQILEMAVAAEEAGWDGFFTWDGISVGEVDTFDPWSMLGALAVKTSNMTLGAMIFPLSRRRPWKVAREAITIDHLSHGRLVIPVGLGAAAHDGGFARVSGEVTDRKQRAELLDDTLAILDRAWTGESFSYQGTHHRVDNLIFRPKPVQQPRIPIWVVAMYPSPKSMNRAIEWDGILPTFKGAQPMEQMKPETVREVVAWIEQHRTSDRPFDLVLEGVTTGVPFEDNDQLKPLADAGATWWIESRWDTDRDTPEALLERIKLGPPRLT
ncbi:MAG: LLM class flavin-dependent oxidoreductase [Thermomicrobiales bacterium]